MTQEFSKLFEKIRHEETENDKFFDLDKDGFFDLPKIKTCNHPSHNPPGYIVIPQGKGLRHTCPSCGKVSIVIPQQISL